MTRPYLRRPMATTTTGHKWELDARSGVKWCVRCGETWWAGPLRNCTKNEGKR